MALIKCSECGNMVSSMAQACPSCGCPVSQMAFTSNFDFNIAEIDVGCFPITLKVGQHEFKINSDKAGKGQFCVAEISSRNTDLNDDGTVNISISYISQAISYGTKQEHTIHFKDCRLGKPYLIFCQEERTEERHVDELIYSIDIDVILHTLNSDNHIISKQEYETVEYVTSDFEMENGVLIKYKGNDTIVHIPRFLKRIAKDAFKGCDNVAYVTFPKKVEIVQNGGLQDTEFYKNPSNWGNDALYVGNHLLKVSPALSGSYSIKYGTTIVEDYAFKNCENLTTIKMPDSVTNIGEGCFYNCTHLSAIELSGNLKDIPSVTFRNCLNLISVSIPSSVKTLGLSSFLGCTNLKKISLSNGLLDIGECAFSGCENLAKIEIPQTVEKIAHGAFIECLKLEEITFPNKAINISNLFIENTAYYKNPSNWENDVLYIGKHLIKALPTLSGSYSIKEETLTVSNGAFFNCDKLKKINICNGVVKICDSAFSGCSSLTNITIPSSVTYIGSSAFFGCEKLKKIIIPAGVNSIESYTFAKCKGLQQVIIPTSVLKIGEGAFSGCKNLIDVVIPNSVRRIEECTFADCHHLEQIILPSDLKFIGCLAFSGCGLKEIAVPPSVTEIELAAFDNIVIRGVVGSRAEEYARWDNCSFKTI